MRVAVIAAALMLNAGALHAMGNGVTSLKGDVNGDGSVSITDVTVLVEMILSGNTTTSRADINDDGTVSVTDVMELVEIILNGKIIEEDDLINVPVEGDGTNPPGDWDPAQTNQGNFQD